MKWLGRDPLLAGALAALLCFATAGAALWGGYNNAQRIFKENLRQDLRTGARVLAMSVDPEIHLTLTRREQETSPEYLQAVGRMMKVREALSTGEFYKYVYTCIRRDGNILFTLDPTPEGDADLDGLDDKSHIGDLYAEANPRLRRVFETGVADVDEEPVADNWGTFLSGYAPVFDAAGNVVAVAGVDLELTRFMTQIAGMRRVGILGLTGAAALSLLAGLAVWTYHRRLQHSIARLVTAMDDAKAADRAKSEFMATISHEIRTPLNGVIGMTGLMLETPLNARQRELAETIHRSGELLQVIINDILDWSKLECGAMPIRNTPVDLHACMEEVRSFFASQAARRGLTLEVTVNETCPERFTGDPGRLRQVLLNLVGNALKFTHRGGVQVHVRPEPGTEACPMLHFTVKDTGIGIPLEQQRKIFQPFSQGDSTTTRRYGGTGLGLAISRRLCQAMGGHIQFRSVAGDGSTFHFSIPAAPVEPPGAAPAAALPEETPSAAKRPVLLLSPDRMIVTLACAVFKRMEHPLECQDNLSSASARLTRGSCRAVLVDLEQMEERSGFPAHLLREAGADRDLKIIALTAAESATPPGGFDAAIPRRLKIHDLERVLSC